MKELIKLLFYFSIGCIFSAFGILAWVAFEQLFM